MATRKEGWAQRALVYLRCGLVVLGDSFVTLRSGTGRVVGWQRPHFVVEDPDGRRLLLRTQSVAESLWFPSEFAHGA